jgi:hypothetical protein
MMTFKYILGILTRVKKIIALRWFTALFYKLIAVKELLPFMNDLFLNH